ncbi:MAG: efflux RND transporter periplasmic adaptor subunit, partial [Candidatus Omnitrophica bacterium]|nr:efflux RND transporter periplasmic adaptor subunit [Candidatus Omnitrophota bacterium]
VDESDIGRIQLNQKAVISLDAYPDTRLNAIVDHIYYESTTVNNVTIYNVDILPESIPDFFRSGMNANVDFILQSKEHILLLPIAAVTKKEDQSFVWLEGEQGQKPLRKEVLTGITDDKNIEITGGLTEEDHVVIRTKKPSLKAKGGSNPFAPARPAGGGSSSGRGK